MLGAVAGEARQGDHSDPAPSPVLGMSESKLDSALDLMRRMPPKDVRDAHRHHAWHRGFTVAIQGRLGGGQGGTSQGKQSAPSLRPRGSWGFFDARKLRGWGRAVLCLCACVAAVCLRARAGGSGWGGRGVSAPFPTRASAFLCLFLSPRQAHVLSAADIFVD